MMPDAHQSFGMPARPPLQCPPPAQIRLWRTMALRYYMGAWTVSTHSLVVEMSPLLVLMSMVRV
jgi:hypothetical protein